MALTVENLRVALMSGPRTTRDPYWGLPQRIIWRTPGELFGRAVLFGVGVIVLLRLVILTGGG